MTSNVIDVGGYCDALVFIPRIPLTSSISDLPFDFQRIQFSLQLAFAMTINKAQGQTLKHVGLCLTEPVVPYGQSYITLSRLQICESSCQTFLKHVAKERQRMLFIQKYLVDINVSFHSVNAFANVDASK